MCSGRCSDSLPEAPFIAFDVFSESIDVNLERNARAIARTVGRNSQHFEQKAQLSARDAMRGEGRGFESLNAHAELRSAAAAAPTPLNAPVNE